jgi:hypothetical protein|tara:strand:- start:504 stop:992 length:489 start_codon:yes stop_codon:yes gene_type:complete
MNIYFDIDDINIDNIFFFKPANNNIIENALFHRTIYSNKLLTLNAIFIKINIDINNIEKFYTKYKFNFDINKNTDTINKIINIENEILDKFLVSNEYLKNKEKTHELHNLLYKQNFKLYTNNVDNHLKNEFILKISGFWETQKKYGLTYKFIDIVNKNLTVS